MTTARRGKSTDKSDIDSQKSAVEILTFKLTVFKKSANPLKQWRIENKQTPNEKKKLIHC